MKYFVRDGKFYSLFFTMTLTIAMQSAIVFSVNLADAIMLSRYSETALAGVALLNQIQFLLQMLVFGIAEALWCFPPAVGGSAESNRSMKSPISP